MRIVAPGPALVDVLRSLPKDREFEVRDASGALALVATLREAEILVFNGAVQGMFHLRRFKFLQLIVPRQAALHGLRQMLSATARMISEASQLTIRQYVAGGVVYSHFTRRTNAYRPDRRGEFMATVTAPGGD